MAPVRKPSNGRSPLVNPNRQITCFFSKVNSPSLSLSSELAKGGTLKSDPNPQSPSPSPATPSPIGSKTRKPLLVVGETPSPSPSSSTPAIRAASYGKEMVGKRIRVCLPSDKTWYEGCVKSFFEDSGRHLVEYDDFAEAVLDLRKEKVEWVEESVKKFKRLRRGSLAFKKTVIEDEELEDISGIEEGNGRSFGSSGKYGETSAVKDTSKENLDFEDEGDDDNVKRMEAEKPEEKNMSRKRKACENRKPLSGNRARAVKI